MNGFAAFLKKEMLEGIRTGRFFLLGLVFALFGIMNPAIAKLTPWLMEQMADSLAESGMAVTAAPVTALASWGQFFKNIPMGLLAFVLVYSGSFPREYQSQTLVPLLTKGLCRYQVVLAKSGVMLLLWSACYWLCFGITWGYNAWLWEKQSAVFFGEAGFCWWLFGCFVIGLLVLFSTLLRTYTGVLLAVGGVLLGLYFAGLFPSVQEYLPTGLMNVSSCLSGDGSLGDFAKSILVASLLVPACIGLSIPVLNRKLL